MISKTSLVQGLILCATFLIYKLASLKKSFDSTSLKEGYLKEETQRTQISNSFSVDTAACTYNVVLRYDGDASLLKTEHFNSSLCELHNVYVISNNKEIISQEYFDSNSTETKIVYIYNEITDVTHLELALSIYYDIMYSLIIDDFVVFSKYPQRWIHAGLESLKTLQKAAILYAPSIQSPLDIKPSPLESLAINAVFARTKTIRRLLTSTDLKSSEESALSQLAAFLHCQEQRLMYVLLSAEETLLPMADVTSWRCDQERYAIRSGCSSSYANEDVAAIISLYKRPYLKHQLLNMDFANYTLSTIVLYQSLGFKDYRSVIATCRICRMFWVLNYDFKLLLRFIFAFALPEHYNLYYSDDIIPSVEMNRYTVESIRRMHAVSGFDPRAVKFLSPREGEYTTERTRREGFCDFLVGMYATESHYSRTVYKVRPYTYNYAEDIHLSFSNALLCNIKSYVFDSHNATYTSHSQDEYALYKEQEGHRLRYATIRYFIENQFVPLERLTIVLGVNHDFTLTKSDLYYFYK